MTKSELIEKVVQAHGVLNMKVSEMLVNTVFDSIEDALKAGDNLSPPLEAPNARDNQSALAGLVD